MQVARAIAERATCTRLHVGAILTSDGRCISSGWNGAPAGMAHCVHTDANPCTKSIHAERNVIGYAARKGYATEHSTMYITHAPCRDCATIIVAAGVARVVYGDTYRSLAGVDYLQGCGIHVSQFLEVA